jgi:predicted double-glycine peptidase
MLIDRIEETMAKVRTKNAIEAEKMGMSLEDWHKYMSKLGNSSQGETKQPQTETTVIYNSADYVLSYLFPPNRKKKKK